MSCYIQFPVDPSVQVLQGRLIASQLAEAWQMRLLLQALLLYTSLVGLHAFYVMCMSTHICCTAG